MLNCNIHEIKSKQKHFLTKESCSVECNVKTFLFGVEIYFLYFYDNLHLLCDCCQCSYKKIGKKAYSGKLMWG